MMRSIKNSREAETTYAASYPNYFKDTPVSQGGSIPAQRQQSNTLTKNSNNRSPSNSNGVSPTNQNSFYNLPATTSSSAAVPTSSLTSATSMGQAQMMASPPNFHHMFSQIAKIKDHLYLSSANPVRLDNLRSLGITLVVSATVESPPVRACSNFEVIHVPVEDSEYANLRNYFDRIADRIHNEERRGGKILVHCMAGISRSATIVLVYLMKYHNISLRDAFTFVRSIRPYICPNIGFWKQMLDYEERIHKTRTVKLVSSGRGFIPDVLIDGKNSSNASTSNAATRQNPSTSHNFKTGFSRF